MLNQGEFANICSRAGITISDASPGIGRVLTYQGGPGRTIVIRFLETDFPDVWKKTMGCILQRESEWILVNRYGDFVSRQFSLSKVDELLGLLVEHYPKINREGDDQYIVAKDGEMFISYDHHMLDDGLAVYTNNVQVASAILTCLNEMGAEIELYSKNG